MTTHTLIGSPGLDDGQIVIGSITLSPPERRVLAEAIESFVRSLSYLESVGPGLGPIGPLYFERAGEVRKLMIFGPA